MDIEVNVVDLNLPKSDYLSFHLPNGNRIIDEKSYSFDASDLEEGDYSIEIFVQDNAKNYSSSQIMFEIDHSVTDLPKSSSFALESQLTENDPNNLLIIFGIIAVVIVSVLVILKQKSKITQKN